MKKIFLILIVALLGISCTTTKQKMVSDFTDIRINIEPNISVTPSRENIEVTILMNEIISGDVGKSFIDSVKYVIFYALNENKVLDSSKISYPQKRKTSFNDNKKLYTLFENYKYRIDTILPKNLNFRIELETKNYKFVKNIKPDLSYYDKLDSNQALMLIPSYKKLESGLIEFYLEAKRLKTVEEEYLPNSESFRVHIMDMNGKIIFSSNYKMNYFQAIGKVKPTEVGDTYIYSMLWNGKDNNNHIIPKGKYQAILSIPSVPKQYIKIISFEWQ